MFRVANASGFYPDWFPAMEQQLTRGHVHALTGDYLAELTMGILSFTEEKRGGYARNFIRQLEAGALKLAMEQGVKILVNAGGLQPEKCAREVARIAEEQGIAARISWVAGDDLREQFADMLAAGIVECEHDLTQERLQSVNAYFGCWPMVRALEAGADVVVAGRCTDASPVMAAAAWHFGWQPTDLDALAGALVAGHIIECGGQATGGNYAFFREIPSYRELGFPIADFEADGSCVITKPDGTDGAVTVDTVKAQLFYEVGAQEYLNPDVTARLDTVQLGDDGPDRVRVFDCRGAAPPPTLKVNCNVFAGYRHVVGVRTCGPNIDEKIALISQQVWDAVGGKDGFDDWIEYRIGGTPAGDTRINNLVEVYFGVRSFDRDKAGRAFADEVVQLALRSIPGMTLTGRPGNASPALACRDAFVHRNTLSATVGFTDNDTTIDVPHATIEPVALDPPARLPPAVHGRSGSVALKDMLGARSGDKGGDANVGVWVRSAADLDVLHAIDAAFIAEATGHPVDRVSMYDFPNLLGRNFLLHGLLGDGAMASLHPDPQAKTLGEFVRAQTLTL